MAQTSPDVCVPQAQDRICLAFIEPMNLVASPPRHLRCPGQPNLLWPEASARGTHCLTCSVLGGTPGAQRRAWSVEVSSHSNGPKRQRVAPSARRGGMAEQFDERKSLLGAMLAKGKHAFIMRWLWVRKRIGRRESVKQFHACPKQQAWHPVRPNPAWSKSGWTESHGRTSEPAVSTRRVKVYKNGSDSSHRKCRQRLLRSGKIGHATRDSSCGTNCSKHHASSSKKYYCHAAGECDLRNQWQDLFRCKSNGTQSGLQDGRGN